MTSIPKHIDYVFCKDADPARLMPGEESWTHLLILNHQTKSSAIALWETTEEAALFAANYDGETFHKIIDSSRLPEHMREIPPIVYGVRRRLN